MSDTPSVSDLTRTEATNASRAHDYWMLAVVLVGAGLGIWVWLHDQFVYDINARDFNPLVFFPLLLGAIGLYSAARAIPETLRLRKHGTSYLEAGPFVPGATFKARVVTSRDLEPEGPFEIALRVVEVRRSGKSVRETLRHESKVSIESAGVRSSLGLTASFEVPAEIPQTAPMGNETEVGTRWLLVARAPFSGLDYEAVFRLAVAESDDDSEASDDPAHTA